MDKSYRVQVRLDEETYEQVKKIASKNEIGISMLLRMLIKAGLKLKNIDFRY